MMMYYVQLEIACEVFLCVNNFKNMVIV